MEDEIWILRSTCFTLMNAAVAWQLFLVPEPKDVWNLEAASRSDCLIPAERPVVDAAKSFPYVCSATLLSVTRAFHVA
jgi:hypothetical protein